MEEPWLGTSQGSSNHKGDYSDHWFVHRPHANQPYMICSSIAWFKTIGEHPNPWTHNLKSKTSCCCFEMFRDNNYAWHWLPDTFFPLSTHVFEFMFAHLSHECIWNSWFLMKWHNQLRLLFILEILKNSMGVYVSQNERFEIPCVDWFWVELLPNSSQFSFFWIRSLGSLLYFLHLFR